MVLNPSGLSTQWFTATPNPIESVFKPFIFTPSARISPLIKLADDSDMTLLSKLHSNRKWDQVGSLLQSLESTCVNEVNGYINDNPDLEELDELFKDCVEAEVKFYR
jgi:secernin